MLFEIGQRVLAGDADPAEIHFHGDEFGIRFGEEEIVRKFSAERLGGLEFERVIVIAELDAGLLAGFAGAIEELRGALPSAGLGALYFADPGANDVVLPDGVRDLQGLRPHHFDGGVIDVYGRRSQTVLVEYGADVFRGMSEIAGEFDFLITDGGDFRDGA